MHMQLSEKEWPEMASQSGFAVIFRSSPGKKRTAFQVRQIFLVCLSDSGGKGGKIKCHVIPSCVPAAWQRLYLTRECQASSSKPHALTGCRYALELYRLHAAQWFRRYSSS